ncbi:MAG: amidohydrolase [Verrucomicrobia bacterium]|nr:amidohydrolase [Verrucomicrobiota bacterium]
MSIPIIDTHQHLIYPEQYPYSWTAAIPALQGKAFRQDDYLTASEGTGITSTIFMETTPDDPHCIRETAFVYQLASRPDAGIAGVIANCRPEQPAGFAAHLDSIANPRLVGLRRILHVMPDELSTTAHFAANLRLLGERNLTFDLCVLARQLPLAMALARKCGNVQFILDHCGVPDVAGQALDPWRADLRHLASLPNVACKISGVLAYAKADHATGAAVRPFVEHCLECFGWDRVVWGSDWPVCTITSTLSKWVAISRELVAHADPSDQHRLFHANATRIYGLERQG